MATVVATTSFSLAKSGTTVNWTVSLSQATTAGSTLVVMVAGGATVTCKMNNTSGAAFNVRTSLVSGQGISLHDLGTSGGDTAVFLTLNGAENIAGIIYEISGLGSFVAATNSAGAVVPATGNDFQSRPTSSVNLASGSGLLVGGWTVTATAASNPFNGANQWRCMGPQGKLYLNAGLQPGANTQFICASGLADVASTARYPANLASAGDYRATSTWVNSSGNTYAVQALYNDSSGVATNPAVNATVGENSLPGTVNNNWFLGSTGTNSAIAGYTDKLSYQAGDTVNFKVDSGNGGFRVEIYRMGYYGWETFGARLMTGNTAGYITGTPAVQSAPSVDGTLGSASCAWSTTASWAIPSGTPSGCYLVLYRSTVTTTNVAYGFFIIRPASSAGKVAVVLPDFTYHAYNVWGATSDHGSISTGAWSGRSFYAIGTDGAATNFAHRAYAVCFDRPYGTSDTQANTFFFDAEQGVIMFLEAQGYDLVYYSSIDLENDPTVLKSASLVVMLGHHEYWTTNVYNAFQNAVRAGVNMVVDSSNTALWHTRFAAADTNKRTLICYKDSSTADRSAGWSGTGFDPVSYTGSWRDTRVGGSVNNTDIRTENSLTGQLFRVSAPVGVAVTVPFAQKGLPLWRNSASVQALTSGQSYTTPTSVLGDELDCADGSSGQPDNLVTLCPTATGTLTAGANAAGTVYSTSVSLTAGFSLHRDRSGALVCNTGSWRGLQGCSRWSHNALGGTVTSVDANWQNMILALFYDLGVAPASARELRPSTDTALTNPSTGAVSGGRSAVALAYGLRAPEDGNAMPFFTGF